MFAAILIILVLPFVDKNRIKSSQFKPLNKFLFFSYIAIFIILGILGGCHPTNTVSNIGGIIAVAYFSILTIFVLAVSILENTLAEISNYR